MSAHKRILIIPMLVFSILSTCGKNSNNEKKIKDKNLIPKSAVVEGENLSLRTSPLPTASEIASLEEGETITIIKRTPKKIRVSGFYDYWYFVRLKSGLEGWVYGARLSVHSKNFVDKKPGDGTKEINDKIKEKIRKRIIGKWWETKTGISTGYRKIYFWGDGSYKYGYGSSPMKEGKYEILPLEKIIFLDKGSNVGDKLKIHRIGSEYRLYAEYKGKTYVFRKGDSDPDSKEIGINHK